MLPQESPIYWTEEETVFVSEGDEYLTYELHYGSPCSTLNRHPAATETLHQPPPGFHPDKVNQQHVVEGAPPMTQPQLVANNPVRVPQISYSGQPTVVNQFVPVPQPPQHRPEEDEEDGDDTEDSPPVSGAPNTNRFKRNVANQYYQQCEAIFRNLIIGSLQRFRTPIVAQTHESGETAIASASATGGDQSHVKRQLEFVAGFVISNILSTAKDWFVTRTSSRLEERLASAEHRLISLNAQTDSLALSQRALAKTLSAE